MWTRSSFPNKILLSLFFLLFFRKYNFRTNISRANANYAVEQNNVANLGDVRGLNRNAKIKLEIFV